jgi:hypothetical protein
LYDTCRETPRYGSLVEVVMLIVRNSRVAQGIAETRAMAQASIGGDAAVEAFSEYTDLLTKRDTEKKRSDMREKLEKIKEMEMVRFRPAEGIGIPKKAKLRSVRRRK